MTENAEPLPTEDLRPLRIVILAAGAGTRMRSDKPKVLHTIAGVPMLHHVLQSALALCPRQIVLVLAPGMEAVEEAARQVLPEIQTAIQYTPLGTGDAVRAALPVLNAGKAENMLVLYGDTPLITLATLNSLLDTLTIPSAPALAVLGMQPENPAGYGRLIINAEGSLERIVEARDASAEELAVTLCNSGVMAGRADVLIPLLDRLSPDNAKGEYYLTDCVALAREQGYSAAVSIVDAGELSGINTKGELAACEKLMQKRLRAAALEAGVTLIEPNHVYLCTDTQFGRDVTVHPYVVFGPGVTVEDGAEIRSFSHIERAIVGPRSIVGPYARLRPGTHLAAEAHIGNFVEIKNTRVETGAKINHLSYVGDAKIGVNANIGAGSITCNYDGFDKYHTEVGDGAFIGSNVALVAPVSVGDGAIVGAGSVITENVEANALAITRAEQLTKPDWARRFRAKKRQKN